VASSVGYDTQSQFTRDYKRLFGAPPATDAARLSGAG
jgi:AraC-like DNA-binding protein